MDAPTLHNMILKPLSTIMSAFIIVSTAHANVPCNEKVSIASAPVPPLVLDKENTLTGVLQSSTETFLADHGLAPSWLIINWARALHMAETGVVDALFPSLYSKEREAYLDYSLEPVSNVKVSLYQHALTQQAPELARSSVATLRSFEYSTTELDDAKVYEVADFKQAIGMLEKRRVDFIFGVKEVLDYEIEQLGAEHVVEYKGVSIRPVYLALARNSPNYLRLKDCLGLHQ
ncbi:substrate-binding periplasmic protein [Alteromonas facilis]|uniref:substrate-binding periplasmic protein n=1 Tax=Alteromonas facilis TaxID=2048004 RepID=UPI000C2866BB|nr:transporter substrate-binding domain-containing protein [Alteromonas facilis]